MVDALKQAAELLGPEGAVVDLRPATRCLHELSVVRGAKRRIIGRYYHAPSSGFIAADEALSQAEAEGWLRIGHRQPSYRLRFANLVELRRYVRAHIKGHLPGRAEMLLRAQWSLRRSDTWLELRERFQINVLRPRRQNRQGESALR